VARLLRRTLEPAGVNLMRATGAAAWRSEPAPEAELAALRVLILERGR
jgi:hypothetical protein